MILITGGMGFIGLHTARRFLDAGEDVVLTTYRTWREPGFIKDDLGKRAHVERLDVADAHALMEVMEKYPIDSIAHMAVPGLGALSAGEDLRVNTQGLLNVLEAARLHGVRRLSLASSIAVYRSIPGPGPHREDDLLPVQSFNPTECFKKAEEVLALHYADRTGLDVVAIRMSGIYGPLYHSMANLPSRLCHAAVKGVPPDFSSGAPYEDDEADFCYVKDCAQGVQLLHMAERLSHRVYNVGGGAAVTNRQLAGAVQRVVPSVEFELRAGRGPGAKPSYYLDVTRAWQDVGYVPAYDIEAGVENYVTWLRGNPQ